MKRSAMMAAAMLVTLEAAACGGWFEGFIPCADPMHRAFFGVTPAEIEAVWARYPELPAGRPADAYRPDIDAARERRLQAAYADLRAALGGGEEAATVALMFQEARAAMTADLRAWEAAPWWRREQEEAPEVDRAVMAPVLERLPEEFAQYVEGAMDFHEGQYDAAAAHFESVLALPPEARQYRSVWAAFMLGRCHLQRERMEDAVQWFERCRVLAEAGFADSLNLVESSWGWQARIAYRSGDMVSAVRIYAEQGMRPEIARAFDAGYDELDLAAMAADPLTRELFTLWVAGEARLSEAWYEALTAAEVEAPAYLLGSLALRAYERGDMAMAQRWAEASGAGEPRGDYVWARLLIRNGQYEEGRQMLERIAARVTEFESDNYWDYLHGFTARDVALGEAGVAAVNEGNYARALEHFVSVREGLDFEWTATHLMTLDELADLVERAVLPSDGEPPWGWAYGLDAPGLPPQQTLAMLHAQRLAREGRWAEAAQTQQEGTDAHARATRVAELVRGAQDEARDNAERAADWMEAAYLVADHGVELLGWPAGPVRTGAFVVSHYEHDDGFGWPPLPDHHLRAELAARAAEVHEQEWDQFFYRQPAAEMMWQAAELLPDNDVRTARALYDGGTWVMHRNPEYADRFYKALVRRNPNLAIAQQADELRWFPAAFTDKVLYQPRNEPLIRKRDAALVFAAAAGFALLLAAARRLRRH